MRIGIIGAGNIGSTLGRRWAAAGHTIIYGARDPQAEKVAALLEATGGGATATTPEGAATAAEAVLLAVPGRAVEALIPALGPHLAGKIVIDATNKVGQSPMDSLALLREHAPDARLFRAFNTLGWENFADPELDGLTIDLFYCGDSGPAQETVHGLIADIGLRPVYIGETEKSVVLDGLTRLWFTLVMEQRRGSGRRIAFKKLGD